jgi:hypothetical protein
VLLRRLDWAPLMPRGNWGEEPRRAAWLHPELTLWLLTQSLWIPADGMSEKNSNHWLPKAGLMAALWETDCGGHLERPVEGLNFVPPRSSNELQGKVTVLQLFVVR